MVDGPTQPWEHRGQGGMMSRSMRRECRQHEFPEQVRARHASNFDQRVGRDQACSLVQFRIIHIRQAAGSEVSQDMREVELVVAVVGTADEG